MISKLLKNKVLGIVAIQIFSKITGVLREIILANFFGGSLLFASYLKLMTYGQIIAIFYTEGGLGANLMKKFSLMHKRGMSFVKIRRQSIAISIIIFFLVTLLQLLAWKFIITTDYNFIYIIILSGLSSSLVFYHNIGQIILLSKSNYSNYYKSNFLRSFVYIVFIYPLLSLFNILGEPLNRLLSVFVQYFNTWGEVSKTINESKGKKMEFTQRDFNVWVFLNNNSIFIWYVLLRMYFSFIEGIDIIYISYGFILASSFDGIIIKSFSTYVLERSVNIKYNIKKTVLYGTIVSAISIFGAILFGKFFIKILFGLSHKFSVLQLENIYKYFIVLLILVCTNGICNLVFQKVFAGRRKIQFLESKIYMLISFAALFLITIVSIFNDFRFLHLVFITIIFSIINVAFMYRLLKNA